MYVEHPYKFNDKFYAKVDGKFYEITREVAKAMLSAYRNEIYRSKKWQPEDPETMTRKTKWTELLDCVFSENTDGIGVQDLPDECQRSVEDLVILQAESAELHQNIAKLSEHEQFIIKSIYFEGMKQVELAKKLGISKVRMSQKVSAILMLGTDNATVYEILKKNNIETVTVNERMRVPTDAFWDWYYSQSRYRTQEDRKKDAAAGAASLSMPEMARLLDVPRSTVYGILSSKKYAPLLDVIVIAGRRRVTKESFERFLQAQDTYELFNFEYEELELKEKREYENYKRRCLAEADHSQEKKRLEYLTVPEAAELAGVEPATIAYWYTTGKISVRKTGKIIRIPREVFEQWLLKRKEKGVV